MTEALSHVSPTEFNDTVNRIEDSAGALSNAASSFFSDAEHTMPSPNNNITSKPNILYSPTQDELPRPSYNLLAAQVLASNPQAAYGNGLRLNGANSAQLRDYPNLRVIIGVKTRDQRDIYLPGVVLLSNTGDDQLLLGGMVLDAIMDEKTVDTPPSTMAQLLLDELFTLQSSDPSTLMHRPSADSNNTQNTQASPVNAAEIAHLSLVSSSSKSNDIHSTVHTLADGGAFAQQFSARGSQNFIVGDKVRGVNNKVIPASQASSIYVFPSHQPVPEQMPNLSLTPTERAAGMILAAAVSRGERPNLERNFTAVTEQIT